MGKVPVRGTRRAAPRKLASVLLEAPEPPAASDEPSERAFDAAARIMPGGDGSLAHGRPTLRQGIAELGDALRAGAGARPLLILAGLNLVDELDRAAFQVLGPRIQDAFGLSDAGLGAINSIGVLLFVGAAVAVGAMADRVRRTWVAAGFAVLWAVMVGLVGAARNVGQLAAVRFGEGLGKSSVLPVHNSLIADYYPVEVRSRAYALHGLGSPAGFVLGALVAGSVGATFGFRWAFVVAAIPTFPLAWLCSRLPEPTRGRQERTSLLGVAAAALEGPRASLSAPPIPFGSAVSRLLRIRSLYYMYVGFGVLGFGLVSAPLLVNLYYENVWGVGEFGRGVIAAIVFSAGLVGLPIGGVLGDRRFRSSPRAGILFVSAAIGAYSAVSPIGLYLPQLWMVVAFQFVAGVGLGVAGPALNGALSVVIPPKLRSLGFALVGLFILLGGGFAGSIIFGAISDATSERFALTLLAPIGVLGALTLSGAALHIRRDVAIVAEEILEEEAERSRLAGGGAPHLLSAHNLDFAYGRTQVLFDVNVDVDEGEVLALLGTNGAGKSTLLRAISGLQHPIRGTIRFDGENITYLEAEDIVRRGILQIPGGRMTFPTLTVTENLRTGAFAWRKDAAVTGRIDQVFEFFPQLDERRSTRAGALSGGEQQMLSLARAMLVRPRLLLVDELSLGLAPVVVEGLIGVLEQMHADGTTLLLVEQSVNVALTIADRAVFLEKGEIRFEGSASSLLRRPDLLRSVFLEGATRR